MRVLFRRPAWGPTGAASRLGDPLAVVMLPAGHVPDGPVATLMVYPDGRKVTHDVTTAELFAKWRRARPEEYKEALAELQATLINPVEIL